MFLQPMFLRRSMRSRNYLLPALTPHLLMQTSRLPGSTSTLLPQRLHFPSFSRSQPDWFRTHVSLLLPAIDLRSARLSYLQHNTRSNKAALKQACCNVQRVTRTAMQAYWSTLCDRIESSASNGKIRGVFEGLKEALGPVPKKSSPLCSLSGELLTDLESQLARWAEHYSLLYAQPVTANTLAITAAVPELPPMSDLDADITMRKSNLQLKH